MNSWIKNVIGVVAGITIIIIVLVVGSIVMLHSSLPEYSGEIESGQLSANVDIYRDGFGVSYIDAQEEMGAYFALGYVHAQERLFQMDLSRRAGEGRLSEIFGSKTLLS